ncbi:MAG: alpha/beta fold hydrolase [Deltaproteobacteria bacterium]|nr:alpha/beta fold hydrolase [Deltaproteobacteria bacterium]MBW2394114.1 alpha/beta fold hydrolase [Deltaproteobacteria bacterium]
MNEAKRIQVGDLEVEYSEAGSGARPFVLVHGFTGSRDDFAEVLPKLSEHGYTLAPDNRGHGGTTNPGVPEGYSLEQMQADLGGFLDVLGHEQVDLLGHSLGGMISLRFVLAHPERVASLVLMDTMPGPMENMPRQFFEAGAKVAREHGMATLFAGMRARPPAMNPEAVKRTMERMGEERYWARIEAKILAMDPEAFAELSTVLMDQAPVTDRLEEIACPTLVLVGEHDVPFVEPAKLMAERIPNARLKVIESAAHSAQFENEAAWLDAIQTHLHSARGD